MLAGDLGGGGPAPTAAQHHQIKLVATSFIESIATDNRPRSGLSSVPIDPTNEGALGGGGRPGTGRPVDINL